MGHVVNGPIRPVWTTTMRPNAHRAILCRNHNVMLGLANDNIEILESAIQYLKYHKHEEEIQIGERIDSPQTS